MQSIRNNKPLIIMFKHFETAAIRNQTERTQFSDIDNLHLIYHSIADIPIDKDTFCFHI